MNFCSLTLVIGSLPAPHSAMPTTSPWNFRRSGMLVQIPCPCLCISNSTNLGKKKWQGLETLYIIRMFTEEEILQGKWQNTSILANFECWEHLKQTVSEKDKLHQLHSHLILQLKWKRKRSCFQQGCFCSKVQDSLVLKSKPSLETLKSVKYSFDLVFISILFSPIPEVNLAYGFSLLESFPWWTLIFTGLSEIVTVDYVLSLLYSLLMDLCCLKIPECSVGNCSNSFILEFLFLLFSCIYSNKHFHMFS